MQRAHRRANNVGQAEALFLAQEGFLMTAEQISMESKLDEAASACDLSYCRAWKSSG